MKVSMFKQILIALFISQGILYSQVPYVPTPQEVVDGMLSLAQVTKDDMVYDLGCGDGRIVITAAKKYGAHGIGVDNNPERIRESNENAKQEGVTDKVEFKEQNLFKTDLSKASVVTLYLLSEINLKLRPKLFKELKPGSRVVSHSFDMDDWEADESKNISGRNIFFWKIPVNASGKWEWTTPGNKADEKYTLQIDQEFQKVKGTLQINKEKYDLVNPKLDGENIEFSINSEDSEAKGIMKFQGKISNNELNGTFGDKNLKVTAKRTSGTMKSLDGSLAEQLGLE